MAEHIRLLSSISRTDRELFSDFFSTLGELSGTKQGNSVPTGFVISKEVYEQFLEHNKLKNTFKEMLARVDMYDHRSLEKTSAALQKLILKGAFPETIKREIVSEYKKMKGATVIVRTSVAASTDLEVRPFRKIMFSITSEAAMLVALKRMLADHFNEATLIAVLSKGYDYRSLPLTWLVQTMVAGSVSGEVVVDNEKTMIIRMRTGYRGGDYCESATVYIPALQKGLSAIVRRESHDKWLLSEKEIIHLAQMAVANRALAQNHRLTFVYEVKGERWNIAGLEACAAKLPANAHTFVLQKKGTVLARGRAVGERIAQGKLVFATTLEKALGSLPGSVLMVGATDARWETSLAKAGALLIESENQESHAAKLCRELSIPCLLGIKKTKQLGKEQEMITVSCAEGAVGFVYKGVLPFSVEPVPQGGSTKTKLTVTLTDTSQAEVLASLPYAGVGLLSEENVYAKHVGIHPLAFVNTKFLSKAVKTAVADFAQYEKPVDAVVRRMAEEIARVAVAFEGREVVYRLSTADTTGYSSLIGGDVFEKAEKNPMIGLRGVSRFIDPQFAPAFSLTCQAVQCVRESWGLTNVSLLIPFCRSIEEGKKILEVLKSHGLERGKNGLKIHVMCEIPSNALLAKEFIKLFDGFSIGLNQLAELTLGLDRTVFSDHAYREEDRVIKSLITQVMGVAHRSGKKVSMCDATPGEYPHFVSFLVQEGIDSIAVTPDRARLVEAEICRAERKAASTPMILPLRLATRAVSMASFAGISMLLTGYTCQAVNLDDTKRQLQQTMEKQVADFKAALERTTAEERAAEIAAQLERYHERGFADFSLSYPAGWTFVNSSNGVEFKAPSGTIGYFSVRRESRKAMKDYAFTSTSTWKGNDVGITNDGVKRTVIIFPNDKAYKETVIIEGDIHHFEKIWQSIVNFFWVPRIK